MEQVGGDHDRKNSMTSLVKEAKKDHREDMDSLRSALSFVYRKKEMPKKKKDISERVKKIT